MSSRNLCLVLISLLAAVASIKAKPSHPFALHSIPDHIDALPPLYPPAHFHSVAAPPLPPPPALFAPAHAAPLPLAHHFAPSLPLPLAAHAPAQVFASAPAPVLPLPALPLAANVLPPVLEAVPFALPPPTYRAIPGPKTTTHHISVGYAFPAAPAVASKLIAHPAPLLHSHFSAPPAPLALAPHLHHHHHGLF